MATVGDVGQLPGGVSAAGAGAAVRKTAALRTAAARCPAAAVAVTPGHWCAETRWDID